MFWSFPLKIQTYESDIDYWGHREFETKEEFIDFCYKQFKIPGQYGIRKAAAFQIEGLNYSRTVTRPNFEGGHYTKALKGTHAYKKYWENEKDKVKNGVIVDGFYLPPFYYWYLNFCPIYDDYKKKTRLPDVWDGDLWYMHYCMLAILQGKHIGGVKGRQKGYSYKHMAILYWAYSWFEKSVNTVGAFREDLVKKSWRFLEGYRKHINSVTAWKRGPTTPKSLEWNEQTIGRDNIPYGLLSKLAGVTFKQKPDNDVGGSQTFFNYEEPGVSPTLLQTLEFIRPALEKGSETTGIIIACGSVGELDDADGIKSIFYNPEDYGFLGVDNVWDTKNPTDKCCIFISEAYNMIGRDKETGRPFMDENGNSDVEFALEWIKKNEEKIKKSTVKAELKQLKLSQKCTSPEQAFAQRTISEFPIEQLRRQQDRILLKEKEGKWDFKPRKGLLFEDERGKVQLKMTNLPPEHEYPIKPDWEDKRGIWTIYEFPPDNPEMYMYFAGVDSVEADTTDTSKSVASVDIFKTAVEVTYRDTDGRIKRRIEGDKLVATYRGRFDTPDKTNEQIWFGIKMFNAFTYAERNKPNFINYMRRNGRAERYLAKEGDVPLFRDLNIKNGNGVGNSKFGFHTGDRTQVWIAFKAYAKEYFFTEFGRLTITKGEMEETIKIYTGIDRIDDYWLLEEFCQFTEGKGNYDRLISFMAALFICKVYQQNRFIKRRNEVPKKENPQPSYQQKSINMLGGEGFRQSSSRQKPRSML
jgi:hypothetical protein